MVQLLYTLVFAWIVMLFGGGCASGLDGMAWPPATEAEVLSASDGYVRAVVGEALFDKGFVRDGGWAARSDVYLYSYRFPLGHRGEHTGTVKTKVSQFGEVQLRRPYSWAGRFDFGVDGVAGYFRIGPRVALAKATRSVFGKLLGHWEVDVGYDDSADIIVWQVQQLVYTDGSSYFDTFYIDPRSGLVLNRFKSHTFQAWN